MAVSTIERPAWAVDSEKRINYGSSSYVNYRKIGNVVMVYVYYRASDGTLAAWSNKSIATLPSGYRPALFASSLANTDRAGSVGTSAYVSTSGSVTINTRYNAITDSADTITASLTYATS